ncbi:MAG: addiction module protein [Alphaproteobacteria bacterium]|nr:addiction module protein [Alphaproteobacteria bacterium]
MSQAEAILKEAMTLSEAERAELAHRLFDSLEPEPAPNEVEEAWASEVASRVEEIRRGEVETVPWREAIEESRAFLRARRA